MTKRQIESIIDAYKKLNSACEAANKAGALDINGPFYEVIWRSFDIMLSQLDSRHGWLSWYIYDNECGKRKMKASARSDDPMKPIRNTQELARLIARTKNS